MGLFGGESGPIGFLVGEEGVGVRSNQPSSPDEIGIGTGCRDVLSVLGFEVEARPLIENEAEPVDELAARTGRASSGTCSREEEEMEAWPCKCGDNSLTPFTPDPYPFTSFASLTFFPSSASLTSVAEEVDFCCFFR